MEYYLSIKNEIQNESKFYSQQFREDDWVFLKEAAESFLVHAYSHLNIIGQKTIGSSKKKGNMAIPRLIIGSENHMLQYRQFYLNLAIGLEILLKSILLKKNEKIYNNRDKTISFFNIINTHIKQIFPDLNEDTIEEIQQTLSLVNLRRNNIAHCSLRSHDSYAHEYRFSYVILFTYEEYFFGENEELTNLLLKSLERSKVTYYTNFKPLKIISRSLLSNNS